MFQGKRRLRRAGAVVGCAVLIGAGLGIGAAGAGAEDPPVTTEAPNTTEAPPATTVDETVCPSDSANGRLVRFLYLAILFRCPDPGGAAYWTARLDAGANRGAVADAIDMSTENLVNNNVVELYGNAFERVPTAAELAAGIESIRRTRGDAELMATLLSSDEFFGKYDTTKDWLGWVYNTVLDRDPDEGGAEFFLAQLGDDPTVAQRMNVAMTLELSAENARGWTAAAIGAAFGRAPDGPGMAFWVGWLLGPGHFQTFRMWTSMLSSNEGYRLAQTQPNPPSEGGGEESAIVGR